MRVDPESAHLPQPVPDMLPAGIRVSDVQDPAVARVVAVSLILALRTARDLRWGLHSEGPPGMGIPGLDAFREAHLPDGHPLAPDAVDAWVKHQAARDGQPSLWLAGVWVHPEQVEWDLSTGELILGRNGVPLRLAQLKGGSAPMPDTLEEVPSYGPRWLYYSTPGWPHARERVRAGGVLDQLRWLSMALTDYTRWTPEQSTTFVLTGLIPYAHEYAHLVAVARGGKHQRAMLHKHLELAIFTTQHEGKRLAERMKQWNTAHPDWKYDTVQHFGGDSNQAVRRLIGGKVLDEDRTQGGGRPHWPMIPPPDQRGGAAAWRS